ncbi:MULTISPECIES: hypothetical protein [Streptomyces]|uniref:hypothetical protein n=1 Tax=Streptomyces TaxID=1883 RepID=UPI001F33FF0A|nr:MULTISPECIES: hypothetical protein [Streptomyces]
MSRPTLFSRTTPQPRHTRTPLRRTRRTLVAAVALGMAVTLSGCNDDSGDAGAAKDKDTDAAASQSPADGSSSGARTDDKPFVEGWQTQTSKKHRFRYDVPGKADKWNVLDEDTALSYTDGSGKPIVVMTSGAHYREGGCPSSPNPKAFGEAGKGQIATVGTTGGGKDGSLKENARNWAGNWGFAAYGGEDHKPKIKVGEPEPWKQNGIEGYTATAEVTVTHRPGTCVPPKAVVHSIAQKLPDGTMHGWVLYADQGVPHALTSDDIKQIMNTVRTTGS